MLPCVWRISSRRRPECGVWSADDLVRIQWPECGHLQKYHDPHCPATNAKVERQSTLEFQERTQSTDNHSRFTATSTRTVIASVSGNRLECRFPFRRLLRGIVLAHVSVLFEQ